jgi:hypothetical protein
VNTFNHWVNNAPEKIEEFSYTSGREIINPPCVKLLVEHNALGEKLVKQIKALVGAEVMIEYTFMDADFLEREKIVKAITHKIY